MRLRPPPLLAVFGLAVLLAAAGAAGVAWASWAQAMEFHAIIDGSQARPPTGSSGRGIGHFTLNETQTVLSYEITFDPWVTNEIFSHIHVDSAFNGADAIVEDLVDGNPKVGVMAIGEPLLLQALLTGHLYVNVHTQTYPQGAIAGAILPGTPAAARSWGRVKALYR